MRVDTRQRSEEANNLCPYGCYWECEHRTPSPEASALHAVHDASGRALQRCRDCGEMFYSALAHSREHEARRQLGLARTSYARFLLEDDF